MTKTEYTEYILQQLKYKNLDYSDFQNLPNGLWMNPNPNSFRLSQIGFVIYQHHSDMTHHQYHCDVDLQLSHVLMLDRKLTSPFYYTSNQSKFKLHIFNNSSVMMWLKLYNNLHQFLENYQLEKG